MCTTKHGCFPVAVLVAFTSCRMFFYVIIIIIRCEKKFKNSVQVKLVSLSADTVLAIDVEILVMSYNILTSLPSSL